MKTIRVLIVDDHAPVRLAMTQLLSATEDITVVGTCDNGADAVSTVASASVDVVLMDLKMPGIDGITATGQILALNPDARVLILTAFEDVRLARRAKLLGAAGYQLKTADPDALIGVVRSIAAGATAFDSFVTTPESPRRGKV